MAKSPVIARSIRHSSVYGALLCGAFVLATLFVDPQTTAQSRTILVGDMILPVSDDSRLGPYSLVDANYPWPGGVVPVEFAPELSADFRASFFWTCNEWSKLADVECVPRSGQATYLKAIYSPSSGICSAQVGIGPAGGEQIIDMNPVAGCHSPSVFFHEIGHVFGLKHEHQRNDRDTYVTINYPNINPALHGAYAIIPNLAPIGPYDFRSNMHYPWLSAGALDPTVPTIIPKPGYEQYARNLGGKMPTLLDGAALRTIYGGTQQAYTKYEANGFPRDFFPSGNISQSPVSFSWKHPAEDPIPIASYHFRARLQGQDTPYLDVALPSTATTYTAALAPGYNIVNLVAKDIGAFSWNYGYISFLVSSALAPPGMPTLTVQQAATNPVSLTWTPGPGGPPAAYQLQAGTAPGSSNLGTSNVGTQTSATFSAPTGQTVHARIVATNAAGSATSNEVSFTVPVQGAPSSPTLTASQASTNPITLTWSPGSGPTPTSYALRVGSSTGSSDFGLFNVGASRSITAPAPIGIRLYVAVIATNAAGSAVSNEVVVHVQPEQPPAVPTLVPVQTAANPITLAWSPGSGPSPVGYTLSVGTAPSTGNLGAFAMGLATSVTASAPVGVPLFVRVVASNGGGATASNEISFTVAPTAPPPVPVLLAPVVTGNAVGFAWTGTTPTYRLKARLAPTGLVIATLPATGATITVPGVPAGTYFVTVVAVGGGLESSESNQVVVTVP